MSDNISQWIRRRELKAAGMAHYIGVGDVKVIPASELKNGMLEGRNYGYLYTISNVEHKGKSVYYTMTERETGKEYQVRRLATAKVWAFWSKH